MFFKHVRACTHTQPLHQFPSANFQTFPAPWSLFSNQCCWFRSTITQFCVLSMSHPSIRACCLFSTHADKLEGTSCTGLLATAAHSPIPFSCLCSFSHKHLIPQRLGLCFHHSLVCDCCLFVFAKVFISEIPSGD